MHKIFIPDRKWSRYIILFYLAILSDTNKNVN